MIPIPLWLLLSAVLAWCASTAGAYVAGRSDGRALQDAAQRRETDIEQRATDAASKAAAQAIANIEVKHVTVKQRLETEIRSVPVYRDCTHDQRVLDDLNRAITGDEPAGDRGLPPTAAADRSVVRSHDGEARRTGPAVPEMPGRSDVGS